LRKRSNQPPAWTKSMPAFAAGCCARDLSGSDHLPFTQEFLAEMLGVRRTSVTTVARTLQEAGMVKYTRGKIEILDIEGLHEGACECYETIKEQYQQLLPVPQ
jgi:DNA-binding transcriptional regulator YhcF (GntR family)